jgi:hypothetical protein
MRRPDPGSPPPRRGLAYIEAVVASFVFALTLAGLGATMMAQEKLMRNLEHRAYVMTLVSSTRQLQLRPGTGGNLFDQDDLTPAHDPDIEKFAFDSPFDLFLGTPPRLLTTFENSRLSWTSTETSTTPPRLRFTRMGPKPDPMPPTRPIAVVAGSVAADFSNATVDVSP